MAAGALVKVAGSAIKVSNFLGKDTKKKSNTITTAQKVKKIPTENNFKLLKKENFSGQTINVENNNTESNQSTAQKSSSNEILEIVKSIEKKVIKIDLLLKNKLELSKKFQNKKRIDEEKERYKKQEEKIEKPKKFNIKEKASKAIPKLSFLDSIKRFIFFTLLGMLYEKILPLIPALGQVFGKAMQAAYFAMEVFGGLANVLTKFLAGGIRLVNGLTKTLAVISGARTDKEIQEFEKTFNKMIDITILVAMLAGDVGSNVLDFFKKGGKGGSGRAAGRSGGVIKGGSGRSIMKGASSVANKATGGVFARGGGRSLTRLGIKLGGKGGGQLAKGAGNFLGKAAGPIATTIMAGFEFMGRKSSGQTNLQSGLGTAASVGGALAGAQGGAMLGAAIGSVIPGAGTLVGGLIGGALGLAGAWAGSKLASGTVDKLTGADKVQPMQGYASGGIIKKPSKGKPQQTDPGKDVGGYKDITKLFPDPHGLAKGGGAGEASSSSGPVWWNPFTWGNKDKKSEPGQQNQNQNPSIFGPKSGALKSLSDTSKTFKKIPFIGELMGISVDIAMGQKPAKPFYKKLADNLVYLAQKLSTTESISSISDIRGDVQKLTTGGIAETVNEDFLNVKFTEKSSEKMQDTLSIIMEKGANDALTDIRKEILKSKFSVDSDQQTSTPEQKDIRDRDPNAKGGYDPRYDDLPSSGGGGGGGGVYKPILDLIAKYEAGAGGWESMYPSTKLSGATKMTIAEVARKASGAVGMYQNMPEYLVARARAVGLNPDKDLYNQENQRKIAVYLIERGQAGVTPRMLKENPDEAMIRLSKVWAAIPVPKDMKGASGPIRKGQSYYSGVGSNKAHITPEMMYQAMGASVKLSEKPQKPEEYKGEDPRSKDGKPIKVGGGNVVSIGKSLISQGFTVAEHPDFTKTPPKGSYTPGKGIVNNVHKGRGHYEGRAIDVTDWRGSLEDSKARYRSVLDSLQNNPNINMLIHDSWGFKDKTGKSGPGGYGHPTHMHVETRFHGGLVNKDSVVKIHKNEFVVDKDTVDLLGSDFFKALNSIENKITLKQVSDDLISRISEVSQGRAYTIPKIDEDYQGEERKYETETAKASSDRTTKNLERFNRGEEFKSYSAPYSGGSGGGSSSGNRSGGGSDLTPIENVEIEPTEPLVPGSKSGGNVNVTLTQTQKEALRILGKYESASSGGYNAVNQMGIAGGRGTSGFAGDFSRMKQHGGKALTDMTVGEILDLQAERRGMSNAEWINQGRLHAVGRYQFIGNTLPGLVANAKLPRNAKFSEEVQDLLALQLMKERGISPWVGPSDHATAAERAIVEAARRDPIKASVRPVKPIQADKNYPIVESNAEDVEKDQQIAGFNSNNKYGKISSGFGDSDNQDTGVDIELFGKRGEISKTFDNNSKQGPYGNRGVEISFPYELIYYDKIPGGRNVGRKSIEDSGNTNRVVKGTAQGGFGHVGSYFYKDPKSGKMFEVMMGHGNKPFRKFKDGEKISPGTVVGWQGASGSSDDGAGGLYDHVTFHVNAVDGGDPGPIIQRLANSLVMGEGAKITLAKREQKKAQAEIAKRKEKEEKKNPIAKAQKSGGNLVSSIASSVSSFFGFGNKPKKATVSKASNKPKITKAQGGGQIGSLNVKQKQINRFADYEDPFNSGVQILYQEKIKYIKVPQESSGRGGISLNGSPLEKSDNSYMLRRN